MDNLKSETISGVKWTAIEKFSTQIVNFLLGLLLARLLSPSDFGTIGMLGIFMAISGTFIDSGFSSALIRKPEISDKDYSTAFYFNIVVGLLCYAIMFVCSPLIARFFDMPILNGIVKVYSVTLFINSLTSVQYAKLNRELNFKLQARISFPKESFKYLFSFGSKLLAAGLLHTLYSNLSTLAIGKFYTSNDLGYYSREV